jgi:hypothetical protein
MGKNTLLPFDLLSVMPKKVSIAFDGGLLSSDAGVLLLREVEKKLGLDESSTVDSHAVLLPVS